MLGDNVSDRRVLWIMSGDTEEQFHALLPFHKARIPQKPGAECTRTCISPRSIKIT